MVEEIARGGEPAWWAILLKGIAAVLLGVLLVLSPAKTLLVLVTLLGAYWLVRGVIGLFDVASGRTEHRGLRLFTAVISILAGGFVLAYPLVSAVLVPLVYVIIIGVLAVVAGVLYIWYGARFGGGSTVVLGVFDVLFGALVLAAPYVAVLAVPYVLGIYAIIEGVALILVSFSLRSHQHTSLHRMAPA